MDFLQSDFSASNANNSGALKKLGKEVMGKLSISQKKTFYETLKKYKGSSNPLQKALGEMDLNKNDGISSSTADKIRRTLGTNFDRSAYRNQRNTSSPQKRSLYVPAPRQGIAPIQQSNSGAQLSQNLIRKNSTVMNTGLVVKR